MQNDDRLSKALALPPLCEPPKTYVEFLQELAKHSEYADTAPAVILRAIETMGEEEVDQETDCERRAFLQTLKKIGIPSWKAFRHVCGSQLFAYRLIKRFLEPAAGGGAQLKKLLVVEGGPASGKDFFQDGIARALESHGTVYAVKGCPDHENPLNLLKFLSKEQLAGVADAAGIELAVLQHMLLTAGEPCQHCYTAVMGDLSNPKETPSLAEIKVERIRLSRRSAGIFEWVPGQDCSLVAALRRANRGILSMPDAFMEREVEPGKTDERLILLDATQYRRLPGLCTGHETVAPSPLDVFMYASTNRGAFETFLKTLPDIDAFTGRSEQLKLPYNLVRVEEERAYRTEMERYEKKAHFGPLALKMIATLAVISRYAVPKGGEPFIDPIDRMRLLQGEHVKVKPRSGSDWSGTWDTESGSSSGGGYGSGYGNNLASNRSGGTVPGAQAKSLPDNVAITPQLMWSLIGPDEGLAGLDMRFMMSLLSRLNQYGLSREGDQSVTALEAIMLLRQVIHQKLVDTTNLTPEQTAILKRCQKWLGGAPKPGDESWATEASNRPGLIESEYRRLLKHQILHVFAPDYEERAQELFQDYVLHAIGYAVGDKKVRHSKLGEIPVNEDLLNDLDRIRVGKSKGAFLDDDEKKFRKALQTIMSDRKDEIIEQQLEGLEPDSEEYKERRKALAREYKETWETVPELANAIRTKLDTEIGEAVQKLLTTEVVSDLDKKEQARLLTAKELLEKLGYSPKGMKQILEYAKRVKVWSHQA